MIAGKERNDERPAWLRAFDRWEVVTSPDRDAPEWWAGAPSVARDDAGTFWMAVRMRTADSPLGLRGYELRIYRSEDGRRFEAVHSIRREDVPIPGFERPALVYVPETETFRLYACGPVEGQWRIIRFEDAARPDAIRPESARPVIVPCRSEPTDPALPTGFKDPFVIRQGKHWHCFAIGILGLEQTFHFVSQDGDAWEPVGDPSRSVLSLSGWHSYAVRPASVLPVGAGWLFVYEGSSPAWPDPSYNIATGLGYTLDLVNVVDLTPDEPLLTSPTPGRLRVWRYSHWMWVDRAIYVYAEVEKESGAHEVRLFTIEQATEAGCSEYLSKTTSPGG